MEELSKEAFAALRRLKFSNSKQINDFFNAISGHDFIDWFNQNLPPKLKPGDELPKGELFPFKIPDTPTNRQDFAQFWDALPEIFHKNKISVFDFAALASIAYNETRGQFRNITEKVGNEKHKGLSYAFDKIKDLKVSYNANNSLGNFTAHQCFTDPDFCDAHKDLPLADALSGAADPAKIDPAWKGEVYPIALTDTDPAKTGFIMEADFYKFRGRGVIQTTGRGNYKNLVVAIQAYKGTNPVVLKYQQKWKGWSPDKVCTRSRNADWDDFFQDKQALRFAVAVFNRLDAQGKRPFSMSNVLNVLNGEMAGSFFYMGKKVSGTASYAKNKFKPRVVKLLEKIAGQMRK